MTNNLRFKEIRTDTTDNFFIELGKNNIQGATWIDKFGENPQIDTTSDPEDVWEGGGIYTFSETADINRISSSSADDTDIVVEVQGLDANGELILQNVTLNGQTPVTLITPLWRVFRMQNMSGEIVGTTAKNISGMVYCYTTGATVSAGVPSPTNTIRALIDDGNNQTLMAIYTIPKGKLGQLVQINVGMSRAALTSFARFTYRSRRFNGVFKIKGRVDTSNGYFQQKRSVPDPIPELTDIVIRCEEVSANGTGVFAMFDIILWDWDYSQ